MEKSVYRKQNEIIYFKAEINELCKRWREVLFGKSKMLANEIKNVGCTNMYCKKG